MHAPAHLLQLVLSLDPGGTQRLVIELCRRLRPHAEIMVSCLDGAGSWAHELTELGIPVSVLGRTPGFRPALALRIRALARAHGAAILHCHHYSPFVYGALAALATPGLGLVYTEHGRLSDTPPAPRRRLANRVLARLPGRFFAVSESLRRHMVAEGFPAPRVAVIHNGIDPGPPPEPAARARARRLLGVPTGAVVFGTVARLDPVKDLESLLAGYARARAQLADSVLVVIGDGPERHRLQAHAQRAGLAERVRFAGARDDVAALLPAFTVYVNSSVTEGLSVTLLEAMAAGLPVVATRVGGNPEVVADGETGRLVPARAPAALAAAMCELGRDAALARRWGQAGRRRVQTHFAIEAMVQRYARIYAELGAAVR